MTATYDSVWHAAEKILEIRVCGLWAVDDLAPFYAWLERAIDTHAGPSGARLLLDLSDYPVQSPAVSDGHRTAIARFRESGRVERTAFVAQKAVAVLQHERVIRETQAAISMYADRATAWGALVSDSAA